MDERMTARRMAEKFGGKPVTAEKPTIKTEDGYIVLMDGSAYKVTEDQCACGHRRNYTPSRGTPAEQAYRERFRASCDHTQIVMNAEPSADPCECGCFVAVRKPMREPRLNKVVLIEWICRECGRKRHPA